MVVKIFQMADDTVTLKAGRPRAARILRIIAKVIGIIVAVFFLVMVFGNVESIITSEGLFIVIPLVITIGAFVYAFAAGGISAVVFQSEYTFVFL